METNGYYYFYELCKNGGFSSAAKALYVTQPAVSYAISKLEHQLGVKLIEKGAKKLTLTEYGEDLYRKISGSFDNLLQVDSCIQDWKQECLRPITIAVPEHIASILVVDKVIEFNKKYPAVKFNIISGSSKYLIDLFLANEADILIDCTPIEFERLKSYEKKAWSKQDFVLFCDNSCNIKSLDDKNISKYKFILPSETSNCTSMLMETLQKANLEIDVQCYTSTTDLLIRMVKNSKYIGYAMKDEVVENEKFKILNTTIELPSYEIYKIYSSHVGSYIKEFIDML